MCTPRAASFAALSSEHRALLLALLDTPPGPVSERDLVAAFRRHSGAGLEQHPAELVDRLTDHFLRTVDDTAVTWVHPSWRDLVIEQLREDRAARERFLRCSGLDGLLHRGDVDRALADSTDQHQRPRRARQLRRLDDAFRGLDDYAANALAEFGFPERHRTAIRAFVDDVEDAAREPASLSTARRELLARILSRLTRLAATDPVRAANITARLYSLREEHELPPVYRPRPLSPEFERLLEQATTRPRTDEALVARVLRDL